MGHIMGYASSRSADPAGNTAFDCAVSNQGLTLGTSATDALKRAKCVPSYPQARRLRDVRRAVPIAEARGGRPRGA